MSIQGVRQEQIPGDDAHARLLITTHLAPVADVQAVAAQLEESDDVRGAIRVLRVEGE